jgi:hypothetical protein
MQCMKFVIFITFKNEEKIKYRYIGEKENYLLLPLNASANITSITID